MWGWSRSVRSENCGQCFEVKGTTFGELKVACVRAVATEKGHSTAAAEQVAQAIELPDVAAVEPVDGAVEVLGTLHERGYTLGIVTNGPEALQRAKLRQVALNDLFATVVFDRPERGLKPAVAPFETALVDLASAPAETVAIGDSYTADIEQPTSWA